jgi:hypothetical protein
MTSQSEYQYEFKEIADEQKNSQKETTSLSDIIDDIRENNYHR